MTIILHSTQVFLAYVTPDFYNYHMITLPKPMLSMLIAPYAHYVSYPLSPIPCSYHPCPLCPMSIFPHACYALSSLYRLLIIPHARNAYGQYWLREKWSCGNAGLGKHGQERLGNNTIWAWGIDRNLVKTMG